MLHIIDTVDKPRKASDIKQRKVFDLPLKQTRLIWRHTFYDTFWTIVIKNEGYETIHKKRRNETVKLPGM